VVVDDHADRAGGLGVLDFLRERDLAALDQGDAPGRGRREVGGLAEVGDDDDFALRCAWPGVDQRQGRQRFLLGRELLKRGQDRLVDLDRERLLARLVAPGGERIA